MIRAIVFPKERKLLLLEGIEKWVVKTVLSKAINAWAEDPMIVDSILSEWDFDQLVDKLSDIFNEQLKNKTIYDADTIGKTSTMYRLHKSVWYTVAFRYDDRDWYAFTGTQKLLVMYPYNWKKDRLDKELSEVWGFVKTSFCRPRVTDRQHTWHMELMAQNTSADPRDWRLDGFVDTDGALTTKLMSGRNPKCLVPVH